MRALGLYRVLGGLEGLRVRDILKQPAEIVHTFLVIDEEVNRLEVYRANARITAASGSGPSGGQPRRSRRR